MKKEDLLALGLTEEQADRVIGMNTQDVNQEKAQTTTAQTALAEAQGKLTTASEELEKLKNAGGDGDAAGIKKQLSELQEKYKTDIAERGAKLADRDYSDAITRAISGRAGVVKRISRAPGSRDTCSWGAWVSVRTGVRWGLKTAV